MMMYKQMSVAHWPGTLAEKKRIFGLTGHRRHWPGTLAEYTNGLTGHRLTGQSRVGSLAKKQNDVDVLSAQGSLPGALCP